MGLLEWRHKIFVGSGQVKAMLSLNQVRPFLTAEQKRLLKATISMSGHIMWDNDFVPWINWQDNFHFGTANMPIQYGEMKRAGHGTPQRSSTVHR